TFPTLASRPVGLRGWPSRHRSRTRPARLVGRSMSNSRWSAATTRATVTAQERAQVQAVRNALLAAISHDYRSPLATIMSAASSLAEQGERLHADQRRRL